MAAIDTSVDASDNNRAGYQAWLAALAERPYRLDFYQALRHIESAHPHLPRLGDALRPSDEPIRVAQSAELSFAPAPLHALVTSGDGPPRLLQRIFGLLGPNGPLPTHLTEFARDRTLHHGDASLQRFLDLLTHRFALLFYRAWAEAQPLMSLDRPDDRQFIDRLGALIGLGLPSLQDRDAVPDRSKLFFAGRLARQVRDADGLLAWCKAEFDVPVKIEQWCGHWMELGRAERSRLGGGRRRRGMAQASQGLGQGAVLGGSVWDVQHKFRIVVGPLSLPRYLRFLPGGADMARLRALVRQWVGLEFDWDVQLILARAEVPQLRLGDGRAPAGPPGNPPTTRLGQSTWLGHYHRAADADQLKARPERSRSDVSRRAPTAAAAGHSP